MKLGLKSFCSGTSAAIIVIVEGEAVLEVGVVGSRGLVRVLLWTRIQNMGW